MIFFETLILGRANKMYFFLRFTNYYVNSTF